jgi:hypothetical protein
MTRQSETIQFTRCSTPNSALRDGVRHVLYPRRCWLGVGVLAAGFAGAMPLAGAAPFPPVFPLASLYPGGGGNGSQGFVLAGIDPFDNSGRSVSTAGDINGDGIDDLIVSAADASPGGRSEAGESYVVFGSTQGFPAVLPLARLFPAGGGDGSLGFVLAGIDAYDFSGVSVGAAGDVNGDGIDDVIIGAMNADPNGLAKPVRATSSSARFRAFPPCFRSRACFRPAAATAAKDSFSLASTSLTARGAR